MAQATIKKEEIKETEKLHEKIEVKKERNRLKILWEALFRSEATIDDEVKIDNMSKEQSEAWREALKNVKEKEEGITKYEISNRREGKTVAQEQVVSERIKSTPRKKPATVNRNTSQENPDKEIDDDGRNR